MELEDEAREFERRIQMVVISPNLEKHQKEMALRKARDYLELLQMAQERYNRGRLTKMAILK